MRVALYGFGSINQLVARVLLERGWEIAGVIDIRPELLGEDVGKVIGTEPLGIKVTNRVDVLKKAEVVIHATGSYLDEVFNQIMDAVKLGKDVISTCETLAYPYYRYPELSRKLDEEALSRGSTVLGTGINPGFILDALVIVLSAPFSSVRGIRALRSLDAGKRRKAFQLKVGIGMDPTEFKRKLEEGTITGHVGLAESVLLVANSMGVKLDRVTEAQDCVVSEGEVEFGSKVIPAGKVIGVRGVSKGFIRDEEVISLEFTAYLGAPEFEEITIDGRHYRVSWRSTGVPGDLGTASILVNLVETVASFRPGLITMSDLIPFRPRLVPSGK